MSLSTDLKSKKIKISITTYPKVGRQRQHIKPKEKERSVKMCDQSCMTNYKDRKFLCTLCLNENLDENNNKSKNKNIKRLKNNACPFCHQESKTCIQDASTDTDRKVTSNKNDYYISDMKCLTSIATGTGTYLESEKNNADKKITNINDEFHKHLKQNDESSYLPADYCRKHGTLVDFFKPAQNTTEKVCKGTKMPLTIENLNQSREVNLKSTKPSIVAFCKAAGSGKIDKDDTAEKKNISNKHKEINDDEKNVVETQTSKNPMDIKTGLSLLNEVLTVFQNQKHCFDCKDASIQAVTDSRNKKLKSLSVSKIIKYSILEEEIARDNSKFTILECCQPDGTNKCKSSLHLTKHKSSSIPQMKLEELKYAMKEKTKSKDTVDEVNRMFAIVGKYGKDSKDNLNRPVIRSGPRILPVVKTPLNHPKNTQEVKDNSSDTSVRNRQLQDMKCFKICQTNDYMSGGDSKESCSKCNEEKRKDDKCVYMLSCRQNVPGPRLCECCKKRNSGCKCQEHYRRVEDSDCSTNF